MHSNKLSDKISESGSVSRLNVPAAFHHLGDSFEVILVNFEPRKNLKLVLVDVHLAFSCFNATVMFPLKVAL